jgi:hypothetical protein
MRVYLPSTLPALARLLAAGEISELPVRGYAITPALREGYSSGELEELEYIALTHAARASLRLLREDSTAARRRVVLAAELAPELVTGIGGFDEPALVEIKAPVPLRLVMSGHLDEVAAMAEISAAVAALPAAEAGDDDAQFTVDSAEGHELLWYATQELEYITD